jgi:hypothetical protein
MQITDQQIDEFIALYRKEYAITLDKKTAYEKGFKLVRLMQLTYLPELTNKRYEKYRKEI